MPTYEYVCKSCGERLEVFQSFNARPLKKHEECGGELQKVFHARGVVFKGSGFYKTDSRAPSKGKGDKGDKGDKTEKTSEKSEKSDNGEKKASAETTKAKTESKSD